MILIPRIRTVQTVPGVVLYQGDSSRVLKTFADESADALVTDPPAGISFMGKGWDSNKGGRDQWIAWLAGILREAHRVLKPGAYALVWALPRTSHWTATALEDAGFDVRDVITHHFGSGFPKSLNVAIAIDKQAGVLRSRGKAFCTAGVGNRKDIQNTTGETAMSQHKPLTKEAEEWEGWGTALKPASEHWILARKPFIGTLVNNVLKHGTGALNIDGCRISAADQVAYAKNWDRETIADMRGGNYKTSKSGEMKNTWVAPVGRWPANLILSGNAIEEMDRQSGNLPGRIGMTQHGSATNSIYGKYTRSKQSLVIDGIADTGGASRFFYTPKPSRREREAGLEDFPAWTSGEATGGRKEGSAGLDNPRAGAGRTASVRNHHPTVKSITLMRYLTRLITPPNGIVLDPFMGSGSTGCACVLEGLQFRGIDLDADYIRIADARITYWQSTIQKRLTLREIITAYGKEFKD